jgi:hypothetical protein
VGAGADGRAQDIEQDQTGFDRAVERPDDQSGDDAVEDFAGEAPSNDSAMEDLATFDAEVSIDERRRMIAEAAYFIAQRRGFDGSLELEDWLAAEAEVNARLGSD